ncbi:unnamed protein product [Toxocara canis]|uniref:Uncharacterized protein n=1 Tax=Toxocara canis TaxID=6265 RepID=A0A183UHB7_TOXCA|nr:unnamed protein product [Toxocara canis]
MSVCSKRVRRGSGVQLAFCEEAVAFGGEQSVRDEKELMAMLCSGIEHGSCLLSGLQLHQIELRSALAAYRTRNAAAAASFLLTLPCGNGKAASACLSCVALFLCAVALRVCRRCDRLLERCR